MQKIKFLFLVVVLTFISAISIFAQDNSGYTRSINIGMSSPMVYGEDKYDLDHAYDIYSTLQVGYLFDFGRRAGFSIMGEMGYNFSAAANVYEIDNTYEIAGNTYKIAGGIKEGIYMHSIILGVLPAFNINDFSIGIGAGVKIPVSGTVYSTVSFEKEIFITAGQKIEDNIDITPYLKLVFDYSLFVDTKTSMVFALNTGYDFKVGNEQYKASPESYYIGFQVGIKFGPRL